MKLLLFFPNKVFLFLCIFSYIAVFLLFSTQPWNSSILKKWNLSNIIVSVMSKIDIPVLEKHFFVQIIVLKRKKVNSHAYKILFLENTCITRKLYCIMNNSIKKILVVWLLLKALGYLPFQILFSLYYIHSEGELSCLYQLYKKGHDFHFFLLRFLPTKKSNLRSNASRGGLIVLPFLTHPYLEQYIC